MFALSHCDARAAWDARPGVKERQGGTGAEPQNISGRPGG
jgi:hypothetical protein